MPAFNNRKLDFTVSEDGKKVSVSQIAIETLIESKIITKANQILEVSERKRYDVVDQKIGYMEERVLIYLDAKFEKVVTGICEMVTSKMFDAEVERRVKQKLLERGNF